jgi:hypothetical protein
MDQPVDALLPHHRLCKVLKCSRRQWKP